MVAKRDGLTSGQHDRGAINFHSLGRALLLSARQLQLLTQAQPADMQRSGMWTDLVSASTLSKRGKSCQRTPSMSMEQRTHHLCAEMTPC